MKLTLINSGKVSRGGNPIFNAADDAPQGVFCTLYMPQDMGYKGVSELTVELKVSKGALAAQNAVQEVVAAPAKGRKKGKQDETPAVDIHALMAALASLGVAVPPPAKTG